MAEYITVDGVQCEIINVTRQPMGSGDRYYVVERGDIVGVSPAIKGYGGVGALRIVEKGPKVGKFLVGDNGVWGMVGLSDFSARHSTYMPPKVQKGNEQ